MSLALQAGEAPAEAAAPSSTPRRRDVSLLVLEVEDDDIPIVFPQVAAMLFQYRRERPESQSRVAIFEARTGYSR